MRTLLDLLAAIPGFVGFLLVLVAYLVGLWAVGVIVMGLEP